jgi:4'-phosphopantetheinyl transferase
MNIIIILTEDKAFRDYEHFVGELPNERQQKIAAFLRDEDKLLSLMAGLLIKRELPDDALIKTDEYGKPYIANYPGIHFSVSHTKGAVVFVREDSPIGIDIEVIKPFEDIDKIAKRHFAPDEYDYCRGNSARFFEIWTKKEAFIKMVGKGLSYGLNKFSVMEDKRIITGMYEDYYISACSEVCKGCELIVNLVDI